MDKDLSALANLGFPVALSWYLLLRLEKKMDAVVVVIGDLINELRKQ